jgi:SAM-dependent methyltransferase
MSSFVAEFQKKDIELMEKLGRTPFYSGFWNCVRIDKAIAESAKFAHGTLLDVGCGSKPYKKVFAPFVEKHLGLEYSPESVYRGCEANFFGDAMKLPLADNSIDTILCTEVLEHIPNPEKTIAEFARILRPNGVIITTAPFFFPIHDAWDFFRYTHDGLANLMKQQGLEIELIKPLSGTAVTIALLFNLYWFDIGFMWTKWLYPFGVILRPLLLLFCFIVNVLGGIFEVLIPSKQMAFNHLTIAKKPNKIN